MHKSLLELPWNNIYTTNYDTLLEKADEKRNKISKYKLVYSREDIPKKRRRFILKLHGSLKYKDKIKKNEFGFDNSSKHHYIITKGDYNKFLTEHEAFAQLMRIEILRDNFCLIGFSGDDPNFLSWVEWVREVYADKTRALKIYLINIGNADLSEDKKLQFENLNIEYISLQVKFGKNSTKQLIQSFLRFLKFNGNESLWNEILIGPRFLPFGKTKIEKIEIDFNRILSIYQNLKKQYQNNTLFYLGNSKQVDDIFLRLKTNLLEYLESSQEQDSNKIQLLALIALNILTQKLSLSFYLLKEENDNLLTVFSEIDYEKLEKNNKEDWCIFALFLLREARINLDENEFNKWKNQLSGKVLSLYEHNYMVYEELLFWATTYNYEKLDAGLCLWQPEQDEKLELHWLIKKAGLLTLLKKNNLAFELLNKQLEKVDNFSLEQQLRFYEAYKFISLAINFKPNRDIDDEIDVIVRLGYQKIQNICKSYFPEEKKEKHATFEVQRNGSATRTFSANSPQKDSFRLSQILFDFGMPVYINNIVLFKKEEAWDFFIKLAEIHLEYAFYFVLQFAGSDIEEQFIRRFAQTVLNRKINHDQDEEIYNVLFMEIFEQLVSAHFYFLQSTKLFRSNLLLVLSEFLEVIPSKKVNNFFKKNWEYLHKNKLLHLLYPQERLFSYYIFMSKALPLITDKDLLKKVLVEITDLLNDEYNNAKIEYISFLSDNYSLGENVKQFRHEVFNNIDKIIEGIGNDLSINLRILYNMRFLLFDEDRDYIVKKLLESLDNIKKADADLLEIILFFANNDKNLQKKVKARVFEIGAWNTGISFLEGRARMSFESYFFPIHALHKSGRFPEGLIWETKEIDFLWEEMIKAYNLIKKYDIKIGRLFNKKGIIREMLYFMEDEEKKLKVITNYLEVKKEIQNYFAELVGGSSIELLLISNDESSVMWGLNNLAEKFCNNDFKDIESPWNILLNQVFNLKKASVDNLLEAVAFWINELKNEAFIKNEEKMYLLIIEKYYNEPLDDMDRPFIEKQILTIVKILKEWDIENSYIDKWLEYQPKSRFNSIRMMWEENM